MITAGADVIVDFVGGSYWDKNMKSASVDSRMVMLGLVSWYSYSVHNTTVISTFPAWWSCDSITSQSRGIPEEEAHS